MSCGSAGVRVQLPGQHLDDVALKLKLYFSPRPSLGIRAPPPQQIRTLSMQPLRVLLRMVLAASTVFNALCKYANCVAPIQSKKRMGVWEKHAGNEDCGCNCGRVRMQGGKFVMED
ncbi:hypothetical protein FIBSPDRAFT_874465 [Athelia psychrophila]|uniref:Uncharacterized protein n=1 Tax=Athelia psychrophila TaxID=1759441 RepID=A0A165XGU9_9AGAM|nr:hypothetical protein FIBSPDRAFT_874465 [Fibularhizoctonia sp. CBS 109695]